jgi:regulatory protein YycI of two-component signal transduction system YycFG
MIAGDAFLMLVAVILLSEGESGIAIFMLVFLAVDAFLSVDYILDLHRQNIVMKDQEVEEQIASLHSDMEEEQLTQKEKDLQRKREAEDDAFVQDIRQEKEDTLEELKDKLTKKEQSIPLRK